jgi:hypothetical protein
MEWRSSRGLLREDPFGGLTDVRHDHLVPGKFVPMLPSVSRANIDALSADTGSKLHVVGMITDRERTSQINVIVPRSAV